MGNQDPRLIQHAENVWSYRHNWERVEPAIGMILTDEGWVVVDGGCCPVHGRQVFEAMKQISDTRTRYVIATHRHWDHTFGNQVFDAPVISSARCKERLLMNMEDDWAPDQVVGWLSREMLPHIPGLSEADFDGLEIILPSETFESERNLEIGGVKMEMSMLAGVHSDDNIGVYLPDQKIFFIGDAFYYLAPEGKIENLPMLIERIATLDAETYIPSHERPHNKEVFEKLRSYVSELIPRVRELAESSEDEKQALEIPFDQKYRGTSFLSEQQHRKLIKIGYREFSS